MAHHIGVFGGTFSPPTKAHMAIVTKVLKDGYCDVVYLIPNKTQLLKPQTPVAGAHRLEMLKIAVAHDPQLEGLRNKIIISSLELDQKRPSYTYETLVELHQLCRVIYKNYQLKLILGQDQWGVLTEWHRWQELPTLCRLLVLTRQGNMKDNDVPHELQGCYDILSMDLSGSSSLLRQKLVDRENTDAWMIPEVKQYIEQHALYSDFSPER